MIREIIRPSSNNYTIHIPEEYINKEVEILVFPFSYNEKNPLPEQNIKTLLTSISEGLEDDDLKRQDDLGREVPNWLT